MHSTKSVVLTAVFAGIALAATQSPAVAAAGTFPVGENVVISNAVSGNYLSTDGQNENPNQDVEVWDRNPMSHNGSGAVWRIKRASDGNYNIQTAPIGKSTPVCLATNENHPTTYNARVRDCNSSDSSQDWKIVDKPQSPYAPPTGEFGIVPVDHPDYSLAPKDARTNPRVHLQRNWDRQHRSGLAYWHIDSDHSTR